MPDVFTVFLNKDDDDDDDDDDGFLLTFGWRRTSKGGGLRLPPSPEVFLSFFKTITR